MIALAPIGGAIGLIWLSLARRLSWRAGAAAALALTVLAMLAPDAPQLAATMAIEAAVVFALAPRLRVARGRAILASGFINAITQPLLYAGLRSAPAAGGPGWQAPLALAEAVVVVVEAGLYLAALADLRGGRGGVLKSLALSLAANAASALIGLVLPV